MKTLKLKDLGFNTIEELNEALRNNPNPELVYFLNFNHSKHKNQYNIQNIREIKDQLFKCIDSTINVDDMYMFSTISNCAVYDLLYNSDLNTYRLGDKIKISLCRLNDKEADIIIRRFYKYDTLKTIGLDYGVWPERIRQIEAKAIRKLRFGDFRRIRHNRFVETIDDIDPELLDDIRSGIIRSCDCSLIENLDFSVRTYNILKRAGVNTYDDLIQRLNTETEKEK